jgi:aldose 1-epimerase
VQAKTIAENLALGDAEFALTYGAYDTPFCLEKDQPILLQDRETAQQMKITTSAPSVVVFCANSFGKSMKLNENRDGYPLCAIALETQQYPNALQIDAAFAPIYDADHPFTQWTSYEFTDL